MIFLPASAQDPAPVPALIAVEPNRVLNRITPAMYGAGIEDVNHEIYGGFYAQRIFGESFEEPAPGTNPAGWRIYGGRWSPDGAREGSGLHVHGGTGPKLVREGPEFADGRVEAEIDVPNDLGENAGLLVRVANPDVGADAFTGYEISISPKRRQIVLGKHRNDFTPLRAVDAPIVPGLWHRVSVALDGPRIRVYLDGEAEPRIDYTDGDRPILAGRIALRAWSSDANFRNVKIDGQSTPISFAGEGVSRMWDRVRTGGATGRYAVEEEAFNGRLSQRIVHAGGSGTVGIANRGLNRWGISVRKGHAMEGRVYLKGTAPVTVALQSADGSRTYASQAVRSGETWTRADFRLNPRVTDANARFVVRLDRKGEVLVDQAVLLDAPEDRYRGLPIRRDIADELLGSGLTFLRYGGTMVNVPGYRWKRMIGDPDRRPPYAGHWVPNSTNGFGIFEFLRFCERAKLASSFAINVEETPEDAADLAEYLVGSTATEWGRRRAADGHPAPYRVDYLEIGNEEGIGNPDPAAMAYYAERFRLLSRAIHSRAPEMKLVCGAWWVPEAPHMKTVFDAIDGVAAAWDFHFWCDDPNAGATIDRELGRARNLFTGWNPRTTLKAVVFEENGNRHDLQRALGHATTLNATRRHGDFVLVDCAANALQPWRQNDNGWDQGGVFFTPDHAWSMPPAVARRMLAREHLPLRVASRAPNGLDVLATRSEDGRTLVLNVVNPTGAPITTGLSAPGFASASTSARVLAGERSDLDLLRGPAMTPRPLAVRRSPEGPTVTFPARSIGTIRFRRR